MGNDKKQRYNRETFLLLTIKEFFNIKDKNAIRMIYDGLINLLEKDENPKHLQQNAEKRRIIERCYDMFRDDEIRKMLYEGHITSKQLLEMSKERVIGDNKRKYDMSHLFNDKIIDVEDEKKLTYSQHEGTVFSFTNLEGEKVDIQLIGTLKYNSTALDECVNKYHVTKTGKDGETENFEGFAEFVLAQMQDDDEYRQVVLNEVLGKNNVELSNAGGYIGGIGKMNSMEIGQEKEDCYGYYYKVSPNYALHYSNDIATMVMGYAKQQANKQVKSKKSEISEGR